MRMQHKRRPTTSTTFSQLNTKLCSRVNQRHFGEKTWYPLSSYFALKQERRCGGNNLSNVTSFIILRSGEGLTSSNKDNSANLPGKKNSNEAFQGVYFPNRGKI